MCIRDRCDQAHLQLRFGLLVEIDHDVAAEDRLERVAPRPCLLYTSDAADERSSVDLGGRRIIKKKKWSKINGNGIYMNTRDKDAIATTTRAEEQMAHKTTRI